jgi:acylphosphatase
MTTDWCFLGVCFRKFTHNEAKRLGLVGYVRNSEHGSVEGIIQGISSDVEEM